MIKAATKAHEVQRNLRLLWFCSQEQLAERMETTQAVIARLESGR